MLETEFIRSLQNNYERIHLPQRPDEQRYQYCILTRGGIRGLLPCSLRYINVNFRNKFSLENQYQEKDAQSVEKWAFLGKNTCKIQRKMVK